MPPSRGDKTRHRWLTQNRTGVRPDEICMAHPMAVVAMTFPNTRLNECLHSVKKKRIDQSLRFGVRSERGEEGVRKKRKILFLTVTKINLCGIAGGASGRRAGDRMVCVCVCFKFSYILQLKMFVSFILNVNNKQLFIRRPVMYSLQGLYCICSGKKDKDETNNAAFLFFLSFFQLVWLQDDASWVFNKTGGVEATFIFC